MGRFQKDVQNEIVRGPLRRDFKKQQWRDHYRACGEDEVDKDLMEAGLLLLDKANHVRSSLQITFSAQLKATTKLRAFVAMANRNFLMIAKQAQAQYGALAEQADSTLFDLLGKQFDMPSGMKNSPDELIQSIADGTQVPLKCLLERDPDLSGNAQFGQLDWSKVWFDFHLGVLYSHVESIWEDCLWNGYVSKKDDHSITFQPKDLSLQVAEVVTRIRSTKLTHEFMLHAIQHFEDLSQRGQVLSPEVVWVKALRKTGKLQSIQLESVDVGSERAQWLLALRVYSSEPYYTQLLDEPQEALQGACINQALTAWTVVSGLAEWLANDIEGMRFPDSVPAEKRLPHYAPAVRLDAIERAVATAANCSLLQAKQITEFLVFKGKIGQELWAQPLVPVGQSTVVPFFATAQSPNLRRIVDIWLRQLGVDLSRRGPAFESHIRSALVESAASSPVFDGSVSCLESPLTFTPPGEREEEIDLVAVVGNILLVGEAKCLLEPTEAKEVARHREKVRGAAEQVKRKASAIERNRDAFRQRAHAAGLSVPTNFRIQPIVLLNNAIHAGIPVNEVPVIDEYILRVFFSGEMVEIAEQQDNGQLRPIKTQVFYRTLEEALETLPSFMAHPPQMESLLKGVTERWVLIPGTDESDWHGRLLTVSCEPEVQR